MQIQSHLWCLALGCILGSQVFAFPSEMQSDDWSASTFIKSSFDQYVKPYTGPVVDKVTNSTVWNVFGRTLDGVQGAINLSREYLYSYYEDHLKTRTEGTLEWIEERTKPIVESVKNRFKKNQD